MRLESRQNCLLRIKIIAVQKQDILALRQTETVVTGTAQTLILLVQHTDPAVGQCQGIAELPAAVGAAVVHKDDLIAGKVLGKHALYALP